MFELTLNKIGMSIDDAFRVTTMLIVIALFTGVSLTDSEWLMQLLGTLIAFLLFDLILSEYSLIKEHKYGRVFGTLIKIGGMFLLVNYFQSKPYDSTFNVTVFGTLTAFIIMELFIINFGDHITNWFTNVKDVKNSKGISLNGDSPDDDVLDNLLDCLPEITKYFIIISIARLITSGTKGFDTQWLTATGFALFGLLIYHMIVKKHVTHKVILQVKETFLDE